MMVVMSSSFSRGKVTCFFTGSQMKTLQFSKRFSVDQIAKCTQLLKPKVMKAQKVE